MAVSGPTTHTRDLPAQIPQAPRCSNLGNAGNLLEKGPDADVDGVRDERSRGRDTAADTRVRVSRNPASRPQTGMSRRAWRRSPILCQTMTFSEHSHVTAGVSY